MILPSVSASSDSSGGSSDSSDAPASPEPKAPKAPRGASAAGFSEDARQAHRLGLWILANLAVHALAMASMAVLLLPTLPGGSAPSDLARVEAIARAPWLFRLGWLPWQLCAVFDVAMAIAIVRTRAIPRARAGLIAALTALAVVPDQLAQLRWVTTGVSLARDAAATGDLGPYLAFERPTFALTACWAAAAYTLGGIAWTWCLSGARLSSRALVAISALVWPLMLAVTLGPLLPAPLTLPPRATAAGNALGFVLLEVWLFVAAERALLRARPLAASGRDAPWRSFVRGPIGAALDRLCNGRVVATLLEPLPVTAMKSRIRDVVYVNYLIPADRAAPFVPEGLELDRLGPSGELALFTFLSFRHQAFGFRFLGPLRELSPPAIQTNWRVHVRDPRTGRHGIVFLTNAIDRIFPALGARLFTEGMPMHWLARASIAVDPERAVAMDLEPAGGSAPEVHARLAPAPADAAWPAPWSSVWPSFADFLAYCVPQDRAMSTQPWRRRTTRQEIHLGIDPASCARLAGVVTSPDARAIVGDAEPIPFLAPAVDFLFAAEEYDPW